MWLLSFLYEKQNCKKMKNLFKIVMNFSIICNKIISREGENYEFIENDTGSF